METAQRRVGQTDATGNFLLAQLFPGTYRISVSAAGFKRHEEANIIVAAAERVVLRPIALQLGDVTESVTVAAEGARVQTQSAERDALIDRAQIQVLPTKGRDIMDVVRLLPGVVDTGAHDVPGSGSTANMNINGARSRTINVAYDGISATDVGNQQGPLMTPNMDSVAEVKVLLTNYQAEYGRSSGGTISVRTKNGTQEFHGTRSSTISWAPYGRATVTTIRRSPSEGPCLLPKTGFNRNRNKLFFFWTLEYLPRKTPTPQTRRMFPTTLERDGDFSRAVVSWSMTMRGRSGNSATNSSLPPIAST